MPITHAAPDDSSLINPREARSTDAGKSVTTLSVASSRRDRDADPHLLDAQHEDAARSVRRVRSSRTYFRYKIGATGP